MREIQNQEHVEARQADINKKRNEITSNLAEKDKNKFDAVEKACKILLEADVEYYLFPLLKNESNKEVMWQYNSLPHTAKYENNGKMTKESENKLINLNHRLLNCIFAWFGDREAKSFEQSIYSLCSKISQAYTYVSFFDKND